MKNPLENIPDTFLSRYQIFHSPGHRDDAIKKEEIRMKINFVKNQAKQNKCPFILHGLKSYM